MKVFLTGSTGFVGGHVARAYAAEGAELRLLARGTSNLKAIEDITADVVVGDLRQPESLRTALRGCDALVHVAADYRLWVRDPQEMYAANVDGTRELLKLAREVGVERVVYTSSVATMGFKADGTIVNEDTPVSEHFRLRDFLTHDQEGIWPKYMVLREEIVDKLELIIDDLQAHGHRVDRLVVMSGFRTPEYNAQGVGRRGGRARDSRHQFGDAADIYVDNGSGEMADLNGDGRVDSRDARVLLESVDRVEAAHPELVGGAGVYRGTRLHGPFLHVDCRGEAARWSVTTGERLHRTKRKRVS